MRACARVCARVCVHVWVGGWVIVRGRRSWRVWAAGQGGRWAARPPGGRQGGMSGPATGYTRGRPAPRTLTQPPLPPPAGAPHPAGQPPPLSVTKRVLREFAGLHHELTEVAGVKVNLFQHRCAGALGAWLPSAGSGAEGWERGGGMGAAWRWGWASAAVWWAAGACGAECGCCGALLLLPSPGPAMPAPLRIHGLTPCPAAPAVQPVSWHPRRRLPQQVSTARMPPSICMESMGHSSVFA